MRALCKASKKTTVVTSTEKIVPLSVSSQKLHYPTIEETRIQVSKSAKDFVAIESAKLAQEAGVPMSSNIVMVGALSGTGMTGLDRNHFEKAVEMNIPRNVPENLAAFAKGFDYVSNRGSA